MRNEKDGRTGKEEREEERREMGGREKRRGWNGEEARVGGRKGEGEEGEIWRIEKAREGSMKEFNGIVICSTS